VEPTGLIDEFAHFLSVEYPSISFIFDGVRIGYRMHRVGVPITSIGIEILHNLHLAVLTQVYAFLTTRGGSLTIKVSSSLPGTF